MVELILLTVAAAVITSLLAGAAATLGFAVALWGYGPYYHDGAERSGARNWPEFRRKWARPFWATLRWCFDHRVAEADVPLAGRPLDAGERAIYGCHPHGVLALATALTFFPLESPAQQQPAQRTAVHALLLSVPVVRDLLLWFGCIDASRDVLAAALARGERVVLVPGGIDEMGAAFRDPDRARPRGFLRLAFELDVPVVPVVCPAEVDVCWTWRGEWPLVTALRRFTAGVVRYPCPTFCMPRLWPTRTRLHVLKARAPLRPADFRAGADAFAAAYWRTVDELYAEAAAARPPRRR